MVGNERGVIHRYSKYEQWRLKHSPLAGEVAPLLSTLVNEALDEGRYHRCGSTVYFSYHEEHCVIAVLLVPEADTLIRILSGTCLSGGFKDKRLDRETTLRAARRCYY